jgi:hypothetical protein
MPDAVTMLHAALQVTYDRMPDVQWSSPYQDIVITVNDTGA